MGPRRSRVAGLLHCGIHRRRANMPKVLSHCRGFLMSCYTARVYIIDPPAGLAFRSDNDRGVTEKGHSGGVCCSAIPGDYVPSTCRRWRRNSAARRNARASCQSGEVHAKIEGGLDRPAPVPLSVWCRFSSMDNRTTRKSKPQVPKSSPKRRWSRSGLCCTVLASHENDRARNAIQI